MPDSLAELREVYSAAMWKRGYRPLQKDVNRTFDKIRRHAQGILGLLEDQDTRLAMATQLVDAGLDHREAKQLIERLKLLAEPPLSRLFSPEEIDLPPATPEARPGSVNDLRAIFVVMLYLHHWPGPGRPKGEPFIEFAHEQLTIAGDPLDQATVRDIIMSIPLSRFSLS